MRTLRAKLTQLPKNPFRDDVLGGSLTVAYSLGADEALVVSEAPALPWPIIDAISDHGLVERLAGHLCPVAHRNGHCARHGCRRATRLPLDHSPDHPNDPTGPLDRRSPLTCRSCHPVRRQMWLGSLNASWE